MFKQAGSTEPLTEKEKEEADNPPELQPLAEDEDPSSRCNFLCHNDMCDNAFATYQEREDHYLIGQCSMKLTSMQTVKKMWTSRFSREMFENLTPQDQRSFPTFLSPIEFVKVLNQNHTVWSLYCKNTSWLLNLELMSVGV